MFNIKEYEILLDESDPIRVRDEKFAIFTPCSYKAGKKIESNFKNSDIEYVVLDDASIAIYLDDFKRLNDKFRKLYILNKQIKQKAVEEFSVLSAKEVAGLPLQKKIEYAEALFPTKQSVQEITETCRKNEANIRACLFHINFPKSFWDEEKQKAERYAALIARQPEITDAMKNWHKASLEDKKHVLEKVAEVFEHVYGLKTDIAFFTEEEERARYKANGFSKDVHVNAAYYKKGKIYFNIERLQYSDNFFAVSTLFHEGTHLRQDYETFNDSAVERVMTSHLNYATIYENLINDKKSPMYKDLYVMQPNEAHAHGLQEYVENRLLEMTGIHKTAHYEVGETKKIHNKAFTMAKIAQYRSSQK